MSADNDQETVTISVKLLKALGWIVSALIAGASGSIGLRVVDPPVYDSFTGADGEKLELDMQELIQAEINVLELKLGNLSDDLMKTKARMPVSYPPPEWQVEWGTWRAGIAAELAAIRADDRHTKDNMSELEGNCTNHMNASEDWKRRIMTNEQSIDNLWKWYQRQTE